MIWWKNYELPIGQWARWQIGPLDLFARAVPGEWVFAWQSTEDPLDDRLVIEIPSATEPDPAVLTFHRHMRRFEKAALNLLPRLADRAFVVRPELPLFLPAEEQALLYVSTPIWVAGFLAEDGRKGFFEQPSFRASDTWFGRDTCEGELCYASRTLARTDLSAISRRPHRAVTPIHISNEGKDALPIEKLRVPMRALSLYQDGSGRLWTDTVSLLRKEGDVNAAMTVSKPGRHQTVEQTLLAEPRSPVESGTIITAFSRFLD
jgi:hypothetical protein